MRPTFELTIDGRTPADALRERLMRLRVTEETGERAGSLEIKLANSPPIAPPRTGVEAEVRLGYESETLHPAGVYVVEGVDLSGPPNAMTIHAAATNFSGSDTEGGIRKALRSQKTRSWDQTTLGGVVHTIAGEQGLQPVVGQDLGATAIAHLDQTDQSDMALLTQLGRRHDAVAKAMAGRLMFLPRGDGAKSDGESLPRVALTMAEISSWKVRKTGKTEYGAVIAHYHDTGQAKRQSVTVGQGEPVKEMSDDLPTEAEARAVAEAELKKQRRQAQELTLQLPGRPDLFAEQPIELTDGPPGTGGVWVVTRIEHTLGSKGLSTSITAGPKISSG